MFIFRHNVIKVRITIHTSSPLDPKTMKHKGFLTPTYMAFIIPKMKVVGSHGLNTALQFSLEALLSLPQTSRQTFDTLEGFHYTKGLFVKWFWRYPIGRIIFWKDHSLLQIRKKSLAQQPTVFSAGETRHIGQVAQGLAEIRWYRFANIPAKLGVFGTFVCWSFHSLKTLDLVMECINKSRPFSVDVILGIEYVCKKTTTSKTVLRFYSYLYSTVHTIPESQMIRAWTLERCCQSLFPAAFQWGSLLSLCGLLCFTFNTLLSSNENCLLNVWSLNSIEVLEIRLIKWKYMFELLDCNSKEVQYFPQGVHFQHLMLRFLCENTATCILHFRILSSHPIHCWL